MLLLVESIKGAWDPNYNNGNQFFQRSFAYCLEVSAYKVWNDLDEYLLRRFMFKDCLEPNVHDMTSKILSILIDFTEDRALFVPLFKDVRAK